MNGSPLWRKVGLTAFGAGVGLRAMAAPLQLVSAFDPSSVPTATGGGNSCNPIISPHGRYVLFAATANNLVSNSSDSPFLARVPAVMNVFLRDRTNGTTTLVSINVTGTGGGNGDSLPTGLSTDGQYALFESSASDLVVGDTNNVMDVFVRDLSNCTTLLVSVSAQGGCGNGASGQSVMTPDGRYVAFSSAATNLVANDTNKIPDIFVRDLEARSTVLASPGAVASSTLPASSDSPQITPDGRYVAFLSTGIKLLPGVTTANEVYLRDLAAGTTLFASTNAHKVTPPNLSPISYNHVISADGQYVAYEAYASSGTAPGFISRYNVQSGSTVVLSSNAVIALGGYKHFRSLDMTPDGRFITFIGKAGASGQCVYVWDGQSGTTIPAIIDTNNLAVTNQLCDLPILDATGQFVAFLSTATNLTANVVAGGFHLYVRDLQSGSTQLVDANTNAVAAAKDWLNLPSLSAGGRFVAFDCTDADLVPNDSNRAYDVFVRDLSTGTTELISARQPALPSQTPSGSPVAPLVSVSADGRYIAFASTTGGSLANTNPFRGIFVRDLSNGSNLLASADTNGLAGADGMATDPSISGDGRYVAFTSSADNLVAGDTNGASDVFLRNLQTGTTTLVSVNTNGSGPGNAASYAPALSADGQRLLFRSGANNLAPAAAGGLFWRDLQAGQTWRVTASVSAPVAMTSDGRFIAYGGAGANLYVWDSQSASSVYTNSSPVISTVAISPDGNRLAGLSGSRVYAADRAAQTNWLLGTGGPAASLSHATLQFSGDGRSLVYTTPAALVPGDTNDLSDVYLYDFQTQSNVLISQSCFRLGAANGPSDSPAISADARFVAYRSLAGDLVPGDTNGVPDVFLYDRLAGSTTLLSVSAFGEFAGNNRSCSPVFSADGQTVVFESWAADLVAGDFNLGADLFTLKLGGSSPIPAFRGQMVFAPTAGPGPTLTWPVVSGARYGVQFKDNLTDPVWQDLNGSVSIVGDRGYATDQAPHPGHRFYRVLAF